MSSGHTQVRDVGGGDGTVVHDQRGDVPQMAENTDPLSRLLSRTYLGLDDGAQTADAWDATSCRSVRRNTFHRYLKSVFRRDRPSDNAPFKADLAPC